MVRWVPLLAVLVFAGLCSRAQSAEADGKAMYEALQACDHDRIIGVMKDVFLHNGVETEEELSISTWVPEHLIPAFHPEFNHIAFPGFPLPGNEKDYWKVKSWTFTAGAWRVKSALPKKQDQKLIARYAEMVNLSRSLGMYLQVKYATREYNKCELEVQASVMTDLALRYLAAYPPMADLRTKYYQFTRNVLPSIPGSDTLANVSREMLLPSAQIKDCDPDYVMDIYEVYRYFAGRFTIENMLESSPVQGNLHEWMEKYLKVPAAKRADSFKRGTGRIKAYVQTMGPSLIDSVMLDSPEKDRVSFDYIGYDKYGHQAKSGWKLMQDGRELLLGARLEQDMFTIHYQLPGGEDKSQEIKFGVGYYFVQLDDFTSGPHGQWSAFWSCVGESGSPELVYTFHDGNKVTTVPLPPGFFTTENETGAELIKVLSDPRGNLGFLRMRRSNCDTVHLELSKYWYDFDSTLVTETSRYDLPGGERTLASDVWAWDGYRLFAFDKFSHTLVCLKNGSITYVAGNGNGLRDGDGSVAQFRDVREMVMGSGGILYLVDMERVVQEDGLIELRPVRRQVQLGAQ